jgi:hypothetical protein
MASHDEDLMPENTSGYKISQPKQSLADYQNMGMSTNFPVYMPLTDIFVRTRGRLEKPGVAIWQASACSVPSPINGHVPALSLPKKELTINKSISLHTPSNIFRPTFPTWTRPDTLISLGTLLVFVEDRSRDRLLRAP